MVGKTDPFELQGQAEGSYFPLYSNGTAQCKKKKLRQKINEFVMDGSAKKNNNQNLAPGK